jgi:hypothetical protein
MTMFNFMIFQDKEEVTFVISNYMDSVHYYSDINNFIIDYMAENRGIASEEENSKIVNNFKEQLENFSIDQLVERKASASKL